MFANSIPLLVVAVTIRQGDVLSGAALVAARPESEKQFQARVIARAKQLGYLAYHTYDSRRSEPGFPDLVLIHVEKRQVLYRELKKERGKLTAKQAYWLFALVQAGANAGIWRPSDWDSGRIEQELT